ncbi:MAG: phosphatase PAP2 family protein, partial [Erysipelotrichaceae bacterium]|nr:phosphatase PAP2 family protein [Erysipelotrichaceae bacterium]
MRRPEIDGGEGFWHWVTTMTFTVDNPLGSFPSIHCYYSWMAFRYSYDVEPRGRRWICWLQLLFTLAVFASTVLVKQHYFIDIPGGVVFAEGFLWLARHTRIPEIFGRAMDRITGKIKNAPGK